MATEGRKTWTARHRFAPIAPRKARLVADLIRGRGCDEALEQLRFTNKRVSKMLRDVLRNAMACADEQEANMGRLYVQEARVDGGPYQRRWMPKDRGRAHPISLRTSHLVVSVAER